MLKTFQPPQPTGKENPKPRNRTIETIGRKVETDAMMDEGINDGERCIQVAEEPIAESKELLTAKEVEALLRIDVKTIYSYVQRGLIPYVRIQSNLRFVKADGGR